VDFRIFLTQERAEDRGVDDLGRVDVEGRGRADGGVVRTDVGGSKDGGRAARRLGGISRIRLGSL
jgi:hypothetical protein